jgi:formamidopyrimidine-DNA glycosylase
VEAVDAAASRAGLNRTEWVTSILTIESRRELAGRTAAVAAKATGATITTPLGVAGDGCHHPKHLRGWERQGLVCGVCDTVLERRSVGA